MVQFQQQITNEVVISDATTGATVVQIGPGPSIVVNEGNTVYTIEPNVNNGGFPGMQWAIGSNDAFINIVPDGNNSPQIGINSGTYTDSQGRVARERLFLTNDNVTLGKIRDSDQAAEGGVLQIVNDDIYLRRFLDNASQTFFGISATGGIVTQTPIVVFNESWHAPTYAAGWQGDASWQLEYRRMADGMVQWRGRALSTGATTNGQTIATITNSAYWSTYPGEMIVSEPGNNNFQKIIWDTSGNIKIGVGSSSTFSVDVGCLAWSTFS